MSSRILVVDDSATLRQEVSEVLTKVGFDVIEAEDGQIGAEMISKDSTISVVICDVNMPRLNGIDMVRNVKSQPQNANLSILMLTTDGQPALIKKAKEAGAKGWIVKPFKPAQLVAVVQKLAGVA
ncbi:MAG TPA: response regulator [Polyangiaceae bacterium]|nr:response regulator [Polyangiaceae bacterium]